MRTYIAVVDKDRDSAFGLSFPDGRGDEFDPSESDCVLAAHGRELAVHQVHDAVEAAARRANAVLHVGRGDHVVVRNVGDFEQPGIPPFRRAERRRCRGTPGRQQVERPVRVLHGDRLGREQVQLLQPAAAVRRDVDGGRQLSLPAYGLPRGRRHGTMRRAAVRSAAGASALVAGGPR